MIETNRLILDNLEVKDAKALFLLASDPSIGPLCGWKPHQSIKESKLIIENVMNDKNDFGIFLKKSHELVGAISIKKYPRTNLTKRDDECEIGFWIGKKYQRNGYCLEAIKSVLNYAFANLNMNKVFCGYYKGNNASKIVQEKAGFIYLKEDKHFYIPLLNLYKDQVISYIKKDDFYNKNNL